MTYKGIDCATPLTAQTAAAIRKAGYRFAGRYLVPATGSLKWKALTAEEAKAISASGLMLLTVFETTADRVKGGAAVGAVDGAVAYACAKRINMPRNGIIYFAVDYEATPNQYAQIEAYLREARKATEEYEIGVYGSCAVCEAMAIRDACSAFWQCVAWSYGNLSPHRNVYQGWFDRTVAGVNVDINECSNMQRAGMWQYEEDEMMTGEQIYNELQEYLAAQPVPEWAAAEYAEAVAAGITDGSRPMQLIPRYQAAIMALRATKS